MDINFYNLYLNVALFGKPESAVYYANFYPGLADTSGSLILQYNGFVSQNAGAKDTWGVNFFQIEGEKGYIYATTGPAALDEIHVVINAGEQIFNEQDNPDRWYYEVTDVYVVALNAVDKAASCVWIVVDKLHEQRSTAVHIISTEGTLCCVVCSEVVLVYNLLH